MVETLCTVFVLLLAVYGAVAIAASIINAVRCRFSSDDQGVKLVLMVKDQQETIEGIVRCVFSGDFLRKTLPNGKFIILDMGSDDETPEILKRLKDIYEYLEVLGINEKEKIFAGFDIDMAK